jgi:hypothetical protein
MLERSHLNLYHKMKNPPFKYSVYTRKGEYHHGYSARLEGSLRWAIDCAKTVGGSVKEIHENGEEIEVFNSPIETPCSL